MNTELWTKALSRRAGLVNGARAAFAAPAVVAALGTGVAHAHSGPGSGSRHSGSDHTGTHTDTRTPEVAGVQVAAKAAVTTATHSHTGTGTGTHFEVAGLNVLFSGSLKQMPVVSDSLSRGAVFFFGQNGVINKIFVRVRRVRANSTFRLVFVQGSTVTPLLQFSTNGEGKFRKVLGDFNVSLPFAQGTFFLQRLDGSDWNNVLQLVKHKS